MNFLPLAKIVDGVIVPNTLVENLTEMLRYYLLEAMSLMGAYISIVAGVFFAYLVIRKAFKWGNKAF